MCDVRCVGLRLWRGTLVCEKCGVGGGGGGGGGCCVADGKLRVLCVSSLVEE